MRTAALALALVAVLVTLGTPTHAALGSPVSPAPVVSGGAPARPLAAPPPATAPAVRAWGLNTTLAPGLLPRPAASAPPIAAISPVPLPPIPSTHPTVMTFLTNSTDCCVSANFTAPVGTWQLIVLNYTGQAVAGVYDSSFRAYIDQAQVFFGTTPEYGIWYDAADVTPYGSLLTGTFNFTFLLGAAVTSGYFLTSVSLLFYPVPSGGVAPSEPNQVIPLWHRVFVSTTSTFVWDQATIPQNVTNASLQLWAYGFGPDEFWYADQPALRTIEVSIDNVSVLDYLPFPFINTGGNDLFAWRPVTGAFTLSDRPYDLDVTGLLASLEGSHNLTATITGVTPGSSWLLGGSLLLYTNGSAPAAGTPTSTFTAGVPHVSSTSHSYTEFVNDSYAAHSTFGGGADARTVSVYSNTSYANVMATSPEWENLSAVERMSQTVVSAINGTITTTWTNWTFPFSADLGSVFVPNAGQGSSYPIYGNVTDYMLDLQQEWNETSATSSGTGLAARSSDQVDYRVTGGNNLFIGSEELISANAAQLLSISFVQSATTADYRASTTFGGLAWTYDHLQIASGYNPPPPNDVATVLVNQAIDPVAVTLGASTSALDVGGSVTFQARAVGGAGNFAYSYLGLPAGCPTTDEPTLVCHPTAPGTYAVWVIATDSDHGVSPASSVTVTVAPAPSVVVEGSGAQLDSGIAIFLGALVSGGFAPYTCTWTVPGDPIVVAPCTAGYAASGNVPDSTLSGSVTVVDATGAAANATFSLAIVAPPTVAWRSPPATTATAPAALSLSVTGGLGVGPYTYQWLVNNSVVQNTTDANFTLLLPGAGSYTVLVELTDADLIQAVVGPVVIEVSGPAAPPGGGTPSGGSTSGSNALEWALLAGAGAGAIGVLGGILVGRGRARRRPPD